MTSRWWMVVTRDWVIPILLVIAKIQTGLLAWSAATHSPTWDEVGHLAAGRLQVQSAAGFPFSYMSFDLGAFENRLAAITVKADENGIATAEFTGTPGTINNVRIKAASPVASGNTEFMVRVLPRGTTR